MLLTIPVLSYQFDLNVELFNFKVFNKHSKSKFKKIDFLKNGLRIYIIIITEILAQICWLL